MTGLDVIRDLEPNPVIGVHFQKRRPRTCGLHDNDLFPVSPLVQPKARQPIGRLFHFRNASEIGRLDRDWFVNKVIVNHNAPPITQSTRLPQFWAARNKSNKSKRNLYGVSVVKGGEGQSKGRCVLPLYDNCDFFKDEYGCGWVVPLKTGDFLDSFDGLKGSSFDPRDLGHIDRLWLLFDASQAISDPVSVAKTPKSKLVRHQGYSWRAFGDVTPVTHSLDQFTEAVGQSDSAAPADFDQPKFKFKKHFSVLDLETQEQAGGDFVLHSFSELRRGGAEGGESVTAAH